MRETPNPLGDDGPDPQKQLFGLGTICQLLQCPPDKVMTISQAAGVEPHFYVDGVPYFRGDGLQIMFDFAAEIKRQVVESN